MRQLLLAFAFGCIRLGGAPFRLFLLLSQLPDYLLLRTLSGPRCPFTASALTLKF